MSQPASLESFQALHTGLLGLSQSHFQDIERLEAQLSANIEDFRLLLDKQPRDANSRNALETGKLEYDGDEFTINKEFQEGALQLADELNLNELQAGQLFLESQTEADTSGRSLLTCSIVRFHQRRTLLLDCLRLLLQYAADVDQVESIRVGSEAVIRMVLQVEEGPNNPSHFVRKCLSSMGETKTELQRLIEKSNGASVLGQGQDSDLLEIREYQRVSLIKQHELIAMLVFYLAKDNYSGIAEFELVLETLKKANRFDNVLVHYFPVLGAYISRFGALENGGTIADARALDKKVMGPSDQKSWTMQYVHAAVRAWWLAEYSGCYGENYDSDLPANVLEEESKTRAKHFADALNDGAFDLLLSLSADVKSTEWHDPARHGLRQWLQRKAPPILSDSIPFSDSFQDILMEQLESFVEAFISNMPDILRKLRVEEDEQRQLSQKHEHDLDLERFIVIISYAFEGRPKAALEAFWDVQDGAMMGFVHWASRRASTPLVSAFCEMLLAISLDEGCATAAHEFLLDDGVVKMRRSHSLTWKQIIKELTFFSGRIRDQPALIQPQANRIGKPNATLMEAFEPDLWLMLESYLRLITRLCTESGAARNFLLQHPTFNILELLLQLASTSIEPRLVACALVTFRSLLSHKTRQISEQLWFALDAWVLGGYSPGSNMPKAAIASPASNQSSLDIITTLATGFEKPNSFVQLLQQFVAPYDDEEGLNDGLPFPENLGSATRMPGIESYVDFAIGRVFAVLSRDLNDPVQSRLLRLTCLDFIATCLDTFNEDLVILANQSNVAVDTAMKASDLKSYMILHPFSRVMEWMFNEKVMSALFATIHQDIGEVGSAAPDSPLILCILRGIHVVTSILNFQPTYLDLVRPLTKSHTSPRRPPVANAAFASFEDGILNYLSIFVDLGLYCGAGHYELTIASLKLLAKLSASPKLVSSPTTGAGRRAGRNKAIAALETNNDADTISRTLLREMDSDINIDQGPEAPSCVTKLQILDFCIACLEAAPSSPTIAHVLLGFKVINNNLEFDPDGPFDRGLSLFHRILNMVLEIRLGHDDSNIPAWLVSLKFKGLHILRLLWISPLSSKLTFLAMRESDSLFFFVLREALIQGGFFWDGIQHSNPMFMASTSPKCLADFFCQRAFMLQYVSAELRQVARGHSPSLKERIFETLLGATTIEQGSRIENPSIFELFDFMDLELMQPEPPSLPPWFKDIDFSACLEPTDELLVIYNPIRIQELLALRRAELITTKQMSEEKDIIIYDAQARELLQYFAMEDNTKLLWVARLRVLRSWVQLATVMLESNDFESSQKTGFVLRMLQTIIPRLESNIESVSEAMELAQLAKILIFSLDFESESFKKGGMGDLVSDRLFHLFQVSLRVISSLGANASLKEIFYSISYRYLTGMSEISMATGIHRRHSIQTIKFVGERLIDLICDDAHSGEPACRISALLLLESLIKLAKKENSKYMIESLNRLNFISILIGSIPNISADLELAAAEDINMQLSYTYAKIAVLLQISQTRTGATAVLNAGLFHCIKASGLFSADPDLLSVTENNHPLLGLNTHYTLSTALLRLICTCLVSKGAQNEQTLDSGRNFVNENRAAVLSILKKSAGVTSIGNAEAEGVDELADGFIMLMCYTGFCDFEQAPSEKRQKLVSFT